MIAASAVYSELNWMLFQHFQMLLIEMFFYFGWETEGRCS